MNENKHLCPAWVGKLMANPLRKLYHNPAKILNKYIKPGDSIIEIGPGMGFFTFPIAKTIGRAGNIYCVDIQSVMLDKINNKASSLGLSQISTILSSETSLGIEQLKNSIDFGLLFAVVHEVTNKELLFNELAQAIKKGGKVLFAEPKGHVKLDDWKKSIALATKSGFIVEAGDRINGSYSAILVRM